MRADGLQLSPSKLRHGWRNAALALVALAGVSASQAQSNAANTTEAVRVPLGALCAQPGGAPVCVLTGNLRGQLAPDKFVTLSTSALAATKQQFDVVQGRQVELRSGSTSATISLSGKATSPNAPPPSAPAGGSSSSAESVLPGASGGSLPAPALGLFIRAEGGRAKSDRTSFDPGYDRSANAITIGADYQLRPAWLVGVALGSRNSRSGVDTSDGTSSGKLSDSGTSVTFYGTWLPVANAYADAAIEFGRSRYDSRRNIPTSPSDSAIGSTSGRETGLSVGGGYGMAQGGWNYGPYGRLGYSRVKIDAFTEQPNSSLSNLAVAAQSATSLLSSIGVQASSAIGQPWGVLIPSARLEWNHQFRNDKARNVVATFASGGAAAPKIDVATTAVDRNYLTLDVGLAASFGIGRSAVLNYSTVLARAGQSSHTVTAEVRLEF